MIILRGNLRRLISNLRRRGGYIVNTHSDQGLMGRRLTAPIALPTTDPNLWAWWSADTTLSNNGSRMLSDSESGAWTDRSGNARTLLANVASCPNWASNECGGRATLKHTGSSFANSGVLGSAIPYPTSVYMLVRFASFQDTKVLICSGPNNVFLQMNGSPRIQAYQNGAYACDNNDMLFNNTWHVLTWILNGASSLLCVDLHADTTGNPGSTGLGNQLLTGGYNSGGFHSTYDLAGLIVSSAANNSGIRAIHQGWLANYAGI